VLTIPNLLSLLRLAGGAAVLWLLLVPGQDPASHAAADVWAIVVLAAGGITDWLDGKLARMLGHSRGWGRCWTRPSTGSTFLAALIGLGVRAVVPWWVVLLLVARDVVLGVCLVVLRRRGYGPFVVTYLGKSATFLLLYAFPLLLAGLQDGWFADLARPFGYAFAIWGTGSTLHGRPLCPAVRAGDAPSAGGHGPPRTTGRCRVGHPVGSPA